jgi:hypothetical protein
MHGARAMGALPRAERDIQKKKQVLLCHGVTSKWIFVICGQRAGRNRPRVISNNPLLQPDGEHFTALSPYTAIV